MGTRTGHLSTQPLARHPQGDVPLVAVICGSNHLLPSPNLPVARGALDFVAVPLERRADNVETHAVHLALGRFVDLARRDEKPILVSTRPPP